MGDKFIPDYAEAFARIQEVTGCGTQQELAVFFGVKQSSISDAKKRGHIPDSWLLALVRKRSITPDWILTGQGARFLRHTDDDVSAAVQVEYRMEIRPPERCAAQELVTELVRRALESLGQNEMPSSKADQG